MSEVNNDAATVEVTESAQTQETDWKAEARKWEQRAKENKSAAEKLAELEEASKSAEQKQSEELAALKAKVSDFETRDQIAAWKTEITSGSHISPALLRGSTREELETHFKELQAAIPASTEQAAVQRFTIPSEGNSPALALNGDGLEQALKNALGIQ